jgi:hypothetical protein
MKEDFERIINELLNHDLTKKEALDNLLFLCSVNSSVKVGDRVRVDGYKEPNVHVLEIEKNRALCKLQNGLEYQYELYRLIRL